MNIEPNTTIYLLRNVPLDNTYTDTMWFENASSQWTHFKTRADTNGVAFTAQTYQRKNINRCRLGVSADTVYNCNYMMFQNTNYGSKWFYAFITKVEYINNAVTEIEYELDVMQTWMFDYQLEKCFVVREHTATDKIGDNIVPENIDIGPIIQREFEYQGDFILGVMFVIPSLTFVGSVTGGIYTGCEFHVFPCDSAYTSKTLAQQIDDINVFTMQLSAENRYDRVVAVYAVPYMYFQSSDTSLPSSLQSSYKTFSMPTTISGHTVRNKKLFTYPYNYFAVDNGVQDSLYRYEFFDDPTSFRFYIYGATTSTPDLVCVPANYENVVGSNGSYAVNFRYPSILDNFPQIAFPIDTFKAWLANITIGGRWFNPSVAKGAINLGIGAATGDARSVAMGASSMLMGVAQTQESLYQATRGAVKGVGTSGTWYALRQCQFAFRKMQITEEFADIVDGFFDRYGYACNKLKTPNTHVRENWTYVKTERATIVGSLPVDDMNKVCGIYDTGVTFWNNPYSVGNYSLSNRCLSEIPPTPPTP